MFGSDVDVSEALPGLFVGSAPSPSSIRWLIRRRHITRVLDLRTAEEGAPDPWPDTVTVRHAPISDRHSPDPALLGELVDWIRAQLGDSRKVLVHCLAGQGRAPTVVLAVLLRMGYPLAEAHRLLRERRPVIAPTDAQLEGLLAYERTLRAPRGD